MKVLFISAFYYPHIGGGAEIILKEQVEGLKRRGYEVVVISTHGEKNMKEDYVDGVKVYRIPCNNIYWPYRNRNHGLVEKIVWHVRDVYSRKTKCQVKSIIKQEKPDVAICHILCGLSISVLDALSECNVKIIHEVHDQYMACINSNSFKKGSFCHKPCFTCSLFRIIHKWKSAKVDAVIGVSNFVLNRFVKLGYYKKSRHFVIHNARQFPIVEKKYWDGKRPLKIGFIGNVSRTKGVDILVKAFLKKELNASLTIAGMHNDKQFMNELMALKGNSDKISIMGFMNSQDFYKQVDVVVIPSVWPDTFPTVAFEACANNVPVICSNIGGLPEIIHGDRNGLLFEPGSIDDLSLILCNLTAEKINRWVDNARKEIQEMTDVDGMFDKIENVLHSVCSTI